MLYLTMRRRRGPGSGLMLRPIPDADLVAWVDVHCIGGVDDRMAVVDMLVELDLTWLLWARGAVATQEGAEIDAANALKDMKNPRDDDADDAPDVPRE